MSYDKFPYVNLLDAQKNNLDLSSVRQWLLKGENPNKKEIRHRSPTLKLYHTLFEVLTLHNDMVYHAKQINEHPEMDNNRLYIPEDIIIEIIKVFHDLPSAGHVGKENTMARISNVFLSLSYQLEL